jgi:hypothetical protein
MARAFIDARVRGLRLKQEWRRSGALGFAESRPRFDLRRRRASWALKGEINPCPHILLRAAAEERAAVPIVGPHSAGQRLAGEVGVEADPPRNRTARQRTAAPSGGGCIGHKTHWASSRRPAMGVLAVPGGAGEWAAGDSAESEAAACGPYFFIVEGRQVD